MMRAVLTRGGVRVAQLASVRAAFEGRDRWSSVRKLARTLASIELRDDGHLVMVPPDADPLLPLTMGGDRVMSFAFAGLPPASFAIDDAKAGFSGFRLLDAHPEFIPHPAFGPNCVELCAPIWHLEDFNENARRWHDWERSFERRQLAEIVQQAELDALIELAEAKLNPSTFAHHFESLIRGDR